MANWLARLFGSRNQRLVSQYSGTVRRINAFEPALQALSDADLADKTRLFRDQLAAGKTVDDLLPEAFAVVREASRRTLGLRHFDVQLIGGMVLHDGKIAEMRTGEGKTLVATLAAYLNALPGTGTHIVTVNEYLAQRDAEWMGPIFRFLGLTVGVVKAGQSTEEKRAAYAADITYGTNNELGFDYLRDNLAFRLEDRMQRDARLRDRRRGGLDPDRRGAHAADHLGSGRGEHGTLRPHQRAGAAAQAAEGRGRRGRLLGGREVASRCTCPTRATRASRA